MKNHPAQNQLKSAIPVILLLLLSIPVFSQNTLDNAGLTSSTPASVAYGMRLLSSSYTGSAIQVRRSSDNTTLDIGFTANGDLDTATLKTFAGAGNAFVTTWYDQSGQTPSQNLTQATAINQPSLITDGIISRQHALPFIRFTNIPAFNSLNLATEMSTVGHVSAVHQMSPGSLGFILGHTNHYYWHSEPSFRLLNYVYTSASIINGLAWTNGVATAPLDIVWPATLTVNELIPLSVTSGVLWDNIGRDRVYHYTTDGGYSELIVFPVALTATDREALYSSQETYFQIGSFTLPVTWLSFTAQQKEETVLLKWQTADEQNTKAFIVQYSINGNVWENIASLPAAGKSSEVLSYQQLHNQPATGINYYRILQTDLDGRHNYSEIRTVRFAGENHPFTLIANPNNRVVQVQVYKATTLSLFNASGMLLWKKLYTAGQHIIPVTGFAKGVYFLKSDEITKKFVL